MYCLVFFSPPHPKNVVYDVRKCWRSQIIYVVIANFYMALHQRTIVNICSRRWHPIRIDLSLRNVFFSSSLAFPIIWGRGNSLDFSLPLCSDHYVFHFQPHTFHISFTLCICMVFCLPLHLLISWYRCICHLSSKARCIHYHQFPFFWNEERILCQK